MSLVELVELRLLAFVEDALEERARLVEDPGGIGHIALERARGVGGR
jgi:hypothetical protein